MPYRRTGLSDAAVTLALRASGGCLRHAAARLGVDHKTVAHRVRTRPSVWPAGVPRPEPRRAGKPRVADEDITDALWSARGDVAAAARAVGLSVGWLRTRVEERPGLMPAELRPREDRDGEAGE